MNADTFVGTTKIGRTFEGAFVEPDEVEGAFVFDYGRLGVYEGEWVGAPEPEE